MIVFASMHIHSLEPWDREGLDVPHTFTEDGHIEILPWESKLLWIFLIGAHHPLEDTLKLVMADFDNVGQCESGGIVPSPCPFELAVIKCTRATLVGEEGYPDFTPVTIYTVDTQDMAEKKEILQLWHSNLARRARNHHYDAEMMEEFLDAAPLTLAK